MKTRRLLLVSILACLPLAGAVTTPAGAVPPTADCPPAFDGPSSFEQILIDFPPPPDVPLEQIIATLDFFDKNDDEMLCVFDVPAPGVNLIDNNASIP
ncbi:MAG TPA: hypothetical protein VGJ99_01840 [Actinomycetota bacterium]|jgi:hypothetical protein